MTICTAYCRSERTLSFFMGRQPVMRSGPHRCWGFTITLRHTTFGRTPLDEWSARRRDLYLTIHNTHREQTSVSQGGIGTHHTSKRATADQCLIRRLLSYEDMLRCNKSVLQKYSLNFHNVMCSLLKVLWCEFLRNYAAEVDPMCPLKSDRLCDMLFILTCVKFAIHSKQKLIEKVWEEYHE